MAELIAHTPQHAVLETSGYIGEPTGTIEITENGEYNVKQYANADVNVPNPPLMDKSINENGVYKASYDDVYGYSQVTVDVPQPSGETTLTENNTTYNVAQYESAKVQIPEEEKTVTPTTSQQIVTPTNGLLRKVTVEGVTAQIDPDIQPENIKQGVDILGIQGILKPIPEPVLIDKTITANGVYNAAEDEVDGYSSVTVQVQEPSPMKKDVNFYDYDGTVLYAFTKEEALALTELPEAPTHEGLTFQRWNRTLAQLQEYVTDYGIGDAGATYITDDGTTRLYLEVGEDVSLDYELYVQIAGGTLSVEVDGVELGSATITPDVYVNHSIPFTLPNRGNVRIDLNFTGTGGFLIGQDDIRTRVFGWDSNQNNSLVKVELGKHITRISQYAFYGCASLNNIVIPDSISSIYGNAFTKCDSLNSIVIPDSIINIQNIVFSGCRSLNSVVIPQSVTSIGSGAFNSCSSLDSIVIPQSVTSIGGSAFQNCSSLKRIVIPQSVTSIDNNAFQNCSSLKRIVIPQSVTSIKNYAFSSCNSLKEVVIPQSVTSIGSYAFQNCLLLKEVVIPQGVTKISTYAFSNCDSLNSVVIPQGVTKIDGNAFSTCDSLNSVVIPQSVTSIGSNAFHACNLLMFLDLTDIINTSNIPRLANANALSSTAEDLTIYVANQEMLEAFSAATNWSAYADKFQIKEA